MSALPAIGQRVRVTFPCSLGYDGETVTGVVTDFDDDSVHVNTGPGLGEGFTLYAAELADARATVVDLGSDAELDGAGW